MNELKQSRFWDDEHDMKLCDETQQLTEQNNVELKSSRSMIGMSMFRIKDQQLKWKRFCDMKWK